MEYVCNSERDSERAMSWCWVGNKKKQSHKDPPRISQKQSVRRFVLAKGLLFLTEWKWRFAGFYFIIPPPQKRTCEQSTVKKLSRKLRFNARVATQWNHFWGWRWHVWRWEATWQCEVLSNIYATYTKWVCVCVCVWNSHTLPKSNRELFMLMQNGHHWVCVCVCFCMRANNMWNAHKFCIFLEANDHFPYWVLRGNWAEWMSSFVWIYFYWFSQ